jgi:iron complex transport system ATP-binding protein
LIKLVEASAGYHARRRFASGSREDENIISNISLSFERGAVSSIIGLNGSGKSTLAKLACGLIAASSGDVLIDGVEISSIKRRKLAQMVSYLPQAQSYANVPIEVLVMHGRFPHLGYPRVYREIDRQIAKKAMDDMDIWELREKSLNEVSGGERQKAYFAMAMAQCTDAVFLDEPATFLDAPHQLDVIDHAKRLRAENKAVVMVSHDLNAALECSDMVALMNRGRLMAFSPPNDILSSGLIEKTFGVEIVEFRNVCGDVHYAFKRRQLY